MNTTAEPAGITGRCDYCQEPGTLGVPGKPDTLEVLSNTPSYACLDETACMRRQAGHDLALQLAAARSLATAYNDGEKARDTRHVAGTLAEQVLIIDHLLAVMGVPGAELHPELEEH